jgi:hypothetical protein
VYIRNTVSTLFLKPVAKANGFVCKEGGPGTTYPRTLPQCVYYAPRIGALKIIFGLFSFYHLKVTLLCYKCMIVKYYGVYMSVDIMK